MPLCISVCHALKLIHTDLKPENILLERDEYHTVQNREGSTKIPVSTRIRIIDFGVCCLRSVPVPQSNALWKSPPGQLRLACGEFPIPVCFREVGMAVCTSRGGGVRCIEIGWGNQQR